MYSVGPLSRRLGVRKDFTPSEMVAIKRHFEPELKKDHPVGRPGKNCGNFPQLTGEKVRDVIGGFVGVSGRTLEKAEAVVEAATATPSSNLDKGRTDSVACKRSLGV